MNVSFTLNQVHSILDGSEEYGRLREARAGSDRLGLPALLSGLHRLRRFSEYIVLRLFDLGVVDINTDRWRLLGRFFHLCDGRFRVLTDDIFWGDPFLGHGYWGEARVPIGVSRLIL